MPQSHICARRPGSCHGSPTSGTRSRMRNRRRATIPRRWILSSEPFEPRRATNSSIQRRCCGTPCVAGYPAIVCANIIHAEMPRSFLRRAWDAVKPPPAPPARRRLNRAQRRLIRGTVTVIALGLTAWGVFAYIAAAPERALSHYQQGMNLLGAGDFQNAVSQFTRALAIIPDYADAYVGRGKALQATG